MSAGRDLGHLAEETRDIPNPSAAVGHLSLDGRAGQAVPQEMSPAAEH